MTFGWPWALAALLLVPVYLAGYVWALRRRRRSAVSYSSVALLRAAQPAGPGRRRHAAFVLMTAALAGLAVAGARPQATVAVPVSQSAVILALDVSGSMCSTDVDPNRLSAAQQAVKQFVAGQGDQTRIGLVVFSGSAQLAVAPTTNHDDLVTAIDNLTTGRGTTIGSAILKSIDAISQLDPDVAPAGSSAGTNGSGGSPGAVTPDAPSASPSAPAGGQTGGQASGNGSYAPEIVVLLTDGANTRGVTPLQAAAVAAERRVRVYPIGFGTTNPAPLVCSAEQLGGNDFNNLPPGGFGGFGAGGTGARRNFLVVDEETLKQVAATTGGAYFAAKDAGQLQRVFNDLPNRVEVQHRSVELTALFALVAALLVALSIAAAVRWTAFPG